MATEIERTGIDMGGSHEPSYYEIALTNRQVVVAFIILLVCLIAAFLSGVWIGREGTNRAQQQLARLKETPAASPAAAAEDKQDGQALQEFKFFNDPKRKPGKSDAQAGRAGSTDDASASSQGRQELPAQARGIDGGGPEARAPRAAEGSARRAGDGAVEASGEGEALPGGQREPAAKHAQREAGAGSGTAGAADAAGRQARGTPRPASAGDSSRTPAPAAGSAAEAGASPSGPPGAVEPPVTARRLPEAGAQEPGAAGDLVIQVFSSADKTQAEALRLRLVKAGQKAYLSPIEKTGRVMYRVRIGPFTSREQAEAAADQVRREQKLDTWITPR